MKNFSLRKALLLALSFIMLAACTGCTLDTEDNSESQASSTEFSEEDALAIAEGGFQAMKEKNSANMVKYINMDIFYYVANKEYLDEEELINAIDSVIKESSDSYNSLGIIGIFGAYENVEFYDIQPFPDEELNNLNEFVINEKLLGEADSFDYNIENAYKLKISYDGIEEESFEEGDEPYVLVVYANGEWKLDVFVSIMKELYDSLSQMQNN